jgi:hypothetical protein
MSNRILEYRSKTSGWPTLEPEAELIYLLAKRLAKHDAERLAVLGDRVDAFGRQRIANLANEILDTRTAAAVRGFVLDRRTDYPHRRFRQRSRRLLLRALRHEGYWVNLRRADEVVGLEVEARFSRFIPVTAARSGKKTYVGLEGWWVCARAGLMISWGQLGAVGRPNLELDEVDSNSATKLIVAALKERMRARVFTRA